MFEVIRKHRLRRIWKEGETLSRFVAKDVRRDIEVTSAAHIDEGIVTRRVRTTHLLHEHKDLTAQAEFGPETEVRIEDAWRWDGPGWGGSEIGENLAAGKETAHAPDQKRPIGGCLAGGCLVPVIMMLLCGFFFGDTGGPLFWVFISFIGGVTGFIAGSSLRFRKSGWD